MLTAMVHSWTRCVLLTSVVECGHWMTSLELVDGLETSRRSVATAKIGILVVVKELTISGQVTSTIIYSVSFLQSRMKKGKRTVSSVKMSLIFLPLSNLCFFFTKIKPINIALVTRPAIF